MDDLPPMDSWMEDILAVMDAAESERAVIVGDTEGAAMAILFAATYPERTVSLVLINAIARLFRGADYPIGMPQHRIAEAAEMFRSQHGTTGAVIDFTAPSVADDERFRRWWVKFQRSTMPPGSVEFLYEWQQHVDVTSALSSVNVPTLVIHRRDNVYHRVAFGKWIADRIAGAQWVELEGADSHPFHVGNYRRDPRPNRGLRNRRSGSHRIGPPIGDGAVHRHRRINRARRRNGGRGVARHARCDESDL